MVNMKWITSLSLIRARLFLATGLGSALGRVPAFCLILEYSKLFCSLLPEFPCPDTPVFVIVINFENFQFQDGFDDALDGLDPLYSAIFTLNQRDTLPVLNKVFQQIWQRNRMRHCVQLPADFSQGQLIPMIHHMGENLILVDITIEAVVSLVEYRNSGIRQGC